MVFALKVSRTQATKSLRRTFVLKTHLAGPTTTLASDPQTADPDILKCSVVTNSHIYPDERSFWVTKCLLRIDAGIGLHHIS